MRVRRRLGLAALMAVALGLLGPVPFAGAAVECHGRTATHVGTPGNDHITGTPGVDVMVGLDGADILDGVEGDDIICGGEGLNDLLFGGPGDDLLDGGPAAGDGTAYAFAPGPVVVDLAAGTATGAHGNDTLFNLENTFGSEFDDVLLGSADNNGLFPFPGDDVVDGRGGDIDSIGYGLASGAVAVTLAGGTAIGADGSDTISGVELVSGTDFDDYLSGDDGENGLFGGEGSDEIYGRRANDTVDGGPGDDYMSGGAGEDFASYFQAPGPVQVNLHEGTAGGTLGSDTLVAVEGIFASHFDDRLVGDDGDNILVGNAGDDLLDGRAGVDWVSYFSTTLEGGATIANPGPVEADLAAETATDHFSGDVDRLLEMEAILGSVGDDVFRGAGGANLLLGDEGDDLLDGRGGRDYLNGGPGADGLFGGKGKSDTSSYSDGPAVTADLAARSATTVEGGDELAGIEAIVGSGSGDTILGNGARNWIFGGPGPDLIFGRGGSDILDGEGGKDEVDGGAGTDYCLSKPNERCEASSLPPAVQAALDRIKELEDLAAKKKKGIKSFKK
ncbi:MAG TPA: calcium-binding protein [Actinomycetota bacterium]|nr:calcium-binding protein [Actinomycetota bacterium]